MKYVVEVEEALGPGIDFQPDGGRGLIGRRARPARPWDGFDRAALVDSDDGRGRRLAAIIGLPVSTFAGARLEVELTGGFRSERGVTLVGHVAGEPPHQPELARSAGNVAGSATWMDREAAELAARSAYRLFRERRSRARIIGGRAWDPAGTLPVEIARFATPHSAAEYQLSRLPPRFLRGLHGLLDDDERILYWVERPMLTDVSLARRFRTRVDRRAALLVLTDRQLLWMVDHAQPDRYLSDWGVDVNLVPIERVLDVRCTARHEEVDIVLETDGGQVAYRLPIELRREAVVMSDLVRRFTAAAGSLLPRRRYPADAIPFDMETATRFGQGQEASSLLNTFRGDGEVLAFLFSPSRPGQRLSAGIALRSATIEVMMGTRPSSRMELQAVQSIRLTLSSLVGVLSFGSAVSLSYPAPLIDDGAAFVRLARRVVANLP